MEKHKISVIVPIFNAENWISRCLNSILNNSYENLEIICIDDGSTDKSIDLLREFEKKDRRIIVVDQSNAGVSAARNKGLEIATGEYISFVDADDWIHKDFFKIMMNAIGDTDIVHCGSIRCDSVLPDKAIMNICKNVFYSSEQSSIVIPRRECWGMVYKRAVIDNIVFPLGVKMAEDKVFLNQVFCNVTSITMLDCSLYYYYRNTESAVYVSGLNLYPAAQEMLRLAKELNNSIILRDGYTSFLSHRYLNMFNADAKSIRENCNQQLRQCSNLAKKIMPFSERTKLNLMVHLPFVYRLYRIATDPTMLDWEKSQKCQRRMK